MLFYVLVGLALAVGVNSDEGDFEKCVDVFKAQNLECCESLINPQTRECLKSHSDDYCASAKCILGKFGHLTAAGGVDEAAVRRRLDAWAGAGPEPRRLAARVRSHCLDGQYEEYAPADETCDPLKMYLCYHINAAVECTKWKQTGACRSTQQAARKCRAALDES